MNGKVILVEKLGENYIKIKQRKVSMERETLKFGDRRIPLEWTKLTYIDVIGFINKKQIPVLIYDVTNNRTINKNFELNAELLKKLVDDKIAVQLVESGENPNTLNKNGIIWAVLGLLAGIGLGVVVGLAVHGIIFPQQIVEAVTSNPPTFTP